MTCSKCHRAYVLNKYRQGVDGATWSCCGVYVMGVQSDRPELGTYTATVQHNKEWTSNLRRNMQLCHAAVSRQSEFCHLLQKTTLPETSYMFLLEKSMMDMAIAGLSEGCVYGVLFRQGHLYYLRFFESGIFSGFFESKGLNIMKQVLQSHKNEDLFWERIFTQDDVNSAEDEYINQLHEKRTKLSGSESKKMRGTGKRYTQVLFENKNSVQKSLNKFHHHVQTRTFKENNVECMGVIVYIEKKKSYKQKQNLNYFSASKCFDGAAFQAAFETHRTEGCRCQQVTFSDVFVPLECPVSWDQQLQYISMFPNWHKWQHKKVSYSQWLSIPDRTEKYKPASVRNQMLYNFREGNMDNVYSICSNYQKIALVHAPSTSTFESLTESPDNDDIVLPASKRRCHEPTRRLTIEELKTNIDTIDTQFSSENIAEERTSYDKFKFAMIENGSVIWRRSAANVNIFAMNEVSMTSGLFQEDCFVHLTKTDINNTTELSCTCAMYGILLQLATISIPEENLDDVDMSDVKCCHMRFFNELISDHLPSLLNNSSKSENKIIENFEAAKDQINEPIYHMKTSSDKTLKFSVYTDDDKTCTFVHITDNILCCQSGFCNALYSSSKRKVLHLHNAETLCPHLYQLKVHADKWMDLLVQTPDSIDYVYLSGDEDEPTVEAPTVEAAVTEDIKGHRFNEETGLWEYPSLSRHIPSQDGSFLLQQAIQLRHSFCDSSFGRDINGYLHSAPDGGYYELPPPNVPDMCKCGAGYTFPNGELSAVSHIATVYTRHGPVKHKIWYRRCLSGTRDCDIGPGDKEAIHFLTRETGAGDEIGWDFVDHVLNSYISFGSYCTIMNSFYKRVNHNSASFMSNNTFIAWFFSWISKFGLDYRQPCSICKFSPKLLAADGTKIGINSRHSTVVAMETATNDSMIDPCHRRNERAFISFAQGDHDSKDKAQSRNHLLYLSKRVLGTLDSANELSVEEVKKRNDILLQHVDINCHSLLNIFVQNDCSNRVLRKLAVLFTILSSNHSISSIIPYRFIDEFQSVLNLLRKNLNLDPNVINSVSKFSPEIRDVLFAVKNTDICLSTLEFLDYLVSRVRQLFSNCKEPDQINPKPGSYNPAKFGRAYYFTPHGNQLRDIPNYTIDNTSHNSNYDDEPARAEDKCHKKYPEVGRKGTTYLFLWFDPQHYGHCYGYHMIPGHEGRKDPACSAYAYMENAPEEVFYDFSCQLEEYCLNREPGFWKNTRFFHDTFHGFSHKCPPMYNASRLMLLKQINTEICEQTNAFLQHIKYSARAMGMGKFNHYLQFFMHQWSQKKKQNFYKKCNLAFKYVR